MTTLEKNNINNKQNTNISQYHKKNDELVDYKYICIKKDYFDVNMISINYNNIKKYNNIEIIYKSPTITLDGLFFKTPPIYGNAITVLYKEKNINNITIKLLINQKEHPQFIQILRTIDEYISSYINKFSTEIDNELQERELFNNTNNTNNIYTDKFFIKTLSMLKYEQIIKYYNNRNIINNQCNNEIYQIYLKSYLDKNIISELEKKLNKKYIFTFNISNIYFSNNNLLPLIKCNKCEIIE